MHKNKYSSSTIVWAHRNTRITRTETLRSTSHNPCTWQIASSKKIAVSVVPGRVGKGWEAKQLAANLEVGHAYRLRPPVAHEGRRLRLGSSDARVARSRCAQGLYVNRSAHDVVERCAS
jgi:hypothetical protein